MTFLVLWAVAIGLAVLAASLLVHYAHLHGAQHPRPWLPVARWLHAHVLLALLAGSLAGLVAGAAGYHGFQVLYGPNGLITPPVPAQRPLRGAQHGARPRRLGLLPPRHRVSPPRLFGTGIRQFADLSAAMPPVPYQGGTSSCASWAVGYALRGYYARRAGRYPAGGFAPYYLYSQLTGGRDAGSSLEDNFRLLAQQGIAASDDYPQQRRGDYRTPPTPAQRSRAYPWRSQGYQVLFAGAGQGPAVEEAVRQALVNGDPVVVGLPVYQNLYDASPSRYYVTRPEGAYYGLHAAVATKSDDNGVWLFGSWGTQYGLGGFVEISYGFLDRYAVEGVILILPRAGTGRVVH